MSNCESLKTSGLYSDCGWKAYVKKRNDVHRLKKTRTYNRVICRPQKTLTDIADLS